MTIHRALIPRTAGVAGAAALAARLAASGAAEGEPASTSASGPATLAAATLAALWGRSSESIGLRLDPADFSRLVVDFGCGGTGQAGLGWDVFRASRSAGEP
jgi:hypothetical protein